MSVVDRAYNVDQDFTSDEEFVRTVRRLAKWGNGRIIENASIGHALVLLDLLFDAAKRHKETIRMVSGGLMDKFYSKLVDKATEAMDAGAEIKVVVTGASREEMVDNRFYIAVDEHEQGEIDFRPEHEEDVATPHFVVVGTKRYRIEVDHEQKRAVASFNDAETGTVLVSIFDSLLSGEWS